jgi:hypothetical protein
VVPRRGLDLPLVDESWSLADQYQSGVDRCEATRVRVDIQKDLAARVPARGLGLATAPGPFEQDSAGGFEIEGELSVHHTVDIPRARRDR